MKEKGNSRKGLLSAVGIAIGIILYKVITEILLPMITN